MRAVLDGITTLILGLLWLAVIAGWIGLLWILATEG